MKITMAESMGSILSHFAQTQNNPQEVENLEMAETVDASQDSHSADLTSDDLCSEKDIPELPVEETAALACVSEKFMDASEEPIKEDGVGEGSQTEEPDIEAAGSEANDCQVNGDLSEKQEEPREDADGAKEETPQPQPQTQPQAQPQVQAQVQAQPEPKPQAVVEEKTGKESKKEGKKAKKGKDAEHMSRAIMQALNGLETPEEKIAALCKKYAELLGEHKSLQRESKSQSKQLSQIQRERDHLQSEHGRALLAKSKLESLCRELQRHNKTIKEESLQRAREEDEKRKEISNKFQQTINEITTQMQDNHTRNIKLKEENIELASKLKNLVEQYERREEHIEKLFKHKDLESQLYDAKLQQSNLALTEEKERNKREKEIFLTESVDSKRKMDMLTKQEAQLKAQLAVYTEKFEEFQSTLTKSNEVFQTFKQEMDKMTKKIKKLEKETNMWRVRWENSNKSLMSMVEEKARHEKDLLDKQVKISRLEKLCRALQAERNALIGKARSTQGDSRAPSSDIVLDLNSAPGSDCNGDLISNPQADGSSIPPQETPPPSKTTEIEGTDPAPAGEGDIYANDEPGDAGRGEGDGEKKEDEEEEEGKVDGGIVNSQEEEEVERIDDGEKNKQVEEEEKKEAADGDQAESPETPAPSTDAES